jgi:hypothetical protein
MENISITCVVNVPNGIFNLITICVAQKLKWAYELASKLKDTAPVHHDIHI